MVHGTIKIEDGRIKLTKDGKTEVWERSKSDSPTFIVYRGYVYVRVEDGAQ